MTQTSENPKSSASFQDHIPCVTLPFHITANVQSKKSGFINKFNFLAFHAKMWHKIKGLRRIE